MECADQHDRAVELGRGTGSRPLSTQRLQVAGRRGRNGTEDAAVALAMKRLATELAVWRDDGSSTVSALALCSVRAGDDPEAAKGQGMKNNAPQNSRCERFSRFHDRIHA